MQDIMMLSAERIKPIVLASLQRGILNINYGGQDCGNKMRQKRELCGSSFRARGRPFRQAGLVFTVAYEPWFQT